MFNKITDLINSITMYRLVRNSLFVVVAISFVASFTKFIPYSPTQLAISLALLILVSEISNRLLAKLFTCPTNAESALITSLILFFLFVPPSDLREGTTLVLASLVAMASKYVLSIRQTHLFNPAAIAAVLVPLLGYDPALWWVATPILLPFVAVAGFLVIYKTKRAALAGAFWLTSCIAIFYSNLRFIDNLPEFTLEVLLSWPLVFFSSIMLTEPLTMPPTKKLQIYYGLIVGLLFGLPFQIGPLYGSPEFALVLGNLFAFLVSGKKTVLLTLKRKNRLAEKIYEFVFQTPEQLSFQPGQFLEWTLNTDDTDSRGNRRYFTVASSPTESQIKMAVKVPEKASSFKQELLDLKPGDGILASQLAGDFVLPKDKSEKIVMIAGGIGITPFRSMVKYLIDKKEKRDIVLIYSTSLFEDLVYKDLWQKAEKTIGLKVIFVCSNTDKLPDKWNGHVGRITSGMIKKRIKDFSERTYYLSGPSALVDNYKNLLEKINVKKIVTDYFPGF